ncbi:MAG TPA: ferric reductase-like transmembrane domain-containing protein [Tepidiformaceae bacterium]|nr:ferric reductase-like transmembrane domain-containing protein [Tepidiformaceae bacterium]
MNEAWYISRAAGFVAYGLLFAVVALGLAIHTRAADRVVARWRITDIHEFGSLLALAFVGLHAGILLADTYVGYSVAQILVPFAAPTRTFWTGVGVIAGYLLVLVVASFYVRRWIGYRTWRLLHYATFGLYVMATLHGVFTGTDSVTAWAQLLYITTGGIVLALVLYRVLAANKRKSGRVSRPVQFPLRSLGWGAAALGIAALVTLASGLGPFHWFEGSRSTVATPLSTQANTAPAASPTVADGANTTQSVGDDEASLAAAASSTAAPGDEHESNDSSSQQSHHHDDDHDDD